MILDDGNPVYWFRPINVLNLLIREEPDAIEYLNIETGECFIHTFGTVFWSDTAFMVVDLEVCGITHWRIKEAGYSEKAQRQTMEEQHAKHGFAW